MSLSQSTRAIRCVLWCADDDNRVILNALDDLTDNYINASYVDVSINVEHSMELHPLLSILIQGHSVPKKFIATQGTYPTVCTLVFTFQFHIYSCTMSPTILWSMTCLCASPGPIPASIVDFWRMIWQERVPSVVMITNLVEGKKTKCEQYWPSSGSTDYGPFHVTITNQLTLADYTIRTLGVEVDTHNS